MLLFLILKFFFNNREKTYLAVIIMSLGLSMILSTNMLVSALLIEIEGFSEDVNSLESKITIEPKTNNYFTQNQINEINRELNNTVVQKKFFFSLNFVSMVRNSNASGFYEIVVTDLYYFNNNSWITIDDIENVSMNSFVSTKGSFHFNTNETYNVIYHNLSITLSNITEFTYNKGFSYDILLHESGIMVPVELRKKYNQVNIFINNLENLDLLDRLYSIQDINVEIENPIKNFLVISGKQISNILFILQNALSILIIMSISYIMVNLVHELENEIRILKLIGFTKPKLWMLIQGQTIIISILGFVLSFFISIVFLHILFAFITVTLGLTFGNIAISFSFVAKLFVQSIVVGFLAGVLPSYRGVYY